MIDFRYHLVSIVAIFLALAVGIVLGTTALNGPFTEALQKGNDSLTAELNDLRAQNGTLQRQAGAANTFAQEAAPQLVAHLLDRQSVVLVEAPGVADQVQRGVTTVLQQAGATVTGQVDLQDRFFDTSATTLSYLDQLSAGVKPSGLQLSGGTPQQRAAQVLASAIVTKSAPGTADSASQAILSGFAGGGFLSTSGKPAEHATLAVVMTPADPQTGPGADAANQALTAVAAALDTGGLAAVMAGPPSSSQPGGAIAALRGSSAADQVSTIDDADAAYGQVVVAQVLAVQMRTHAAGSYGGPSADQVAPSPMPTAAPSPSGPASASAARQASTRGQR